MKIIFDLKRTEGDVDTALCEPLNRRLLREASERPTRPLPFYSIITITLQGCYKEIV